MKYQRRREIENFMALREGMVEHHKKYKERVSHEHEHRLIHLNAEQPPDLEEAHAIIKKQLDNDHSEVLDRLDREHEETLLQLIEPKVHEVLRNELDEPFILVNGVIVLPGHYYVNDDNPFGISDEELEREYVEVEDDPSS